SPGRGEAAVYEFVAPASAARLHHLGNARAARSRPPGPMEWGNVHAEADAPRSAHGNEEACLLSLSPWDALHLLYRHVSVLPEETVPIAEAPGRVLARPFAAPGDIPPFPRAAMDGFAVRSVDVSDASPDAPRSLRVVGHVFAGQTPSGSPLEPGEAYRIATGGEMPRGADAVLRKEGATALSDDEIAVPHPVPPGKDVVPAGAGIARDEPLYPAGWLLGINDVAVFAAYGITHVDVVRRPRVAY